MKISVDDQELYTLTELQKQVIQNDIRSETFEDEMKRRLKWVLIDEKYRRSFQRLKKEWVDDLDEQQMNKLAHNGITMIPTDADQLAELIFSQPNYLNRSQRDAANEPSP